MHRPDNRMKTRVALGLCVLLLSSPLLLAQDTPAWWSNRGVLGTNEAVDNAPALQGQLKWMATNAYAEFEANLRNGAGSGIESVISSFTLTNNFYGVNLGQIKYVAQPFYDRLSAEGVTNAYPDSMSGSYPWTAMTTDDADHSMANIGQMKYVFSFDLDKDSDALPDWWEIEWWGDTTTATNGADDADGDNLANSNEYAQGTSPISADTDGDGLQDGDEIEQGYDPNMSNQAATIEVTWPGDGWNLP